MAIDKNGRKIKNPSQTYGAKHFRMRKLRGKASEYGCLCHLEGCAHPLSFKIEWAQIHGSDGDDPYEDYIPLCKACHLAYDNVASAVSQSNRKRKGEKRKQYVVIDMDSYRRKQSERSLGRKCGKGCDCGRHPLRKSTIARKARERGDAR